MKRRRRRARSVVAGPGGPTRVALRERVKELSCLYEIAPLMAASGASTDEVLQRIAEILPASWLHTEVASGAVVLDGREFQTRGGKRGRFRQSADIVVRGQKRGRVEVAYCERRPPRDEGPFLKEERSLIDAVARQVSLFVEGKTLEGEREEMREQLRRADRLATLGFLSASVAHEMNEPLEGILGFAQLVQKTPGLPDAARQDVAKIISACLHAREIVRKMKSLAHPGPAERSAVDLNRLVEEGVSLLENRCRRSGVEIVKVLSSDVPAVWADPTQLHQVLVNLVVNAEEAMPRGGRVTIGTGKGEGTVSLTVQDTGTGIESRVLKRIFDPFFTMKHGDGGTGLGLPIVHRIVSLHGGAMKVDSKPGKGSRFEVVLPIGDRKQTEGKR